MSLGRAVISWIGRHFLLLLIVLLLSVFVPAAFKDLAQKAREFDDVSSIIKSLNAGEEDIKREFVEQKNAGEARVRELEGVASEKLKGRLSEIEMRLVAIGNKEFQAIKVDFQGIGVDAEALKNKAINNIEVAVLQKEQIFLKSLLGYREKLSHYNRIRLDRTAELERLRRAHQIAYEGLQKNRAGQKQLEDEMIVVDRFALTPLGKRLREYEEKEKLWLDSNARAANAYREQKERIESDIAPTVVTPFDLDGLNSSRFTEDISQNRKLFDEKLKDNWVGKKVNEFLGDMTRALPWAIGIVAGIVFTPIAIRTFFYFILAPIAARRPAAAVLPQSDGAIDVFGERGENGISTTSSVARTVTIDAAHELLVHPEYLHSSPEGSSNATKWVLNGRYWLASIAAGLYAITRMRSDVPCAVVLSAAQDPLSELSTITIPSGSAVVLLPRYVVGVLQLRARPLRITSHWRLGTLQAWLTLQLRHFAFHGPVTLIVKGCRGVRIDSAECGRVINRDATIGFSANLGYTSRRSETFVAYIRGKQPLLHDSFSGMKGRYLYQEMPSSRRESGAGRGLGGVTDALLKILGV